jgi:hypothetical protein
MESKRMQFLRREKLESRDYFISQIADIRAGYSLPNEKAVFYKTQQVLRSQGALSDAFETFEDYTAYEYEMLKAKRNGTWNQPKISYLDQSLTPQERNKAVFDHTVRYFMNVFGYFLTDAFSQAWRRNNNIFNSFDEYIEYINNQTIK